MDPNGLWSQGWPIIEEAVEAGEFALPKLLGFNDLNADGRPDTCRSVELYTP